MNTLVRSLGKMSFWAADLSSRKYSMLRCNLR